jgi:SepF-like predicted cell division protein (DUF552 family)
MVFDKIKRAFSNPSGDEDFMNEEYLEIDLNSKKEHDNKVIVKLFILKKYDDIAKILEAIREGYTIAIIDFKVLKQKDPIELKRVVAKLKKTVDALEGSIAGHENFVIVTPAFAKIYKEIETEPTKEETRFE